MVTYLAQRSVYALVFLFWGHQAAARKFPWAKEAFKCVDPPGTDNNFQLVGAYSDQMSVEDCKSKCHKHPYCEGFNYEISTGTCYYKAGIDENFSSEQEVKDPGWNCYIAERVKMVPEITTNADNGPGATTPAPTSTLANGNPAPWTRETFICVDPNGQNYDFEINGKTYTQSSLSGCKSTCDGAPGCVAVNYNFENEHCAFKSKVDVANSKAQSSANSMYACFMRDATPAGGGDTTTPAPNPTPAPTSTSANGTPAPWTRETFICVDPDGQDYDFEINGKTSTQTSLSECESTCDGAPGCVAVNYNFENHHCAFKSKVDVANSKAMGPADSMYACFMRQGQATPAGGGDTTTTLPMWTTLYRWVRQPFVCVDRPDTNNDVEVDGSFFQSSTVNHCEAKCASDRDCMAFNYNTVSSICHWKKDIDVQYSRSQEQTDPDSACYIVDRRGAPVTPNPIASDTTPSVTAPSNPDTTPSVTAPSNPDTTPNPDTPASSGPGGNSPSPDQPTGTSFRPATTTTAPTPVVPITAGPKMNQTAPDAKDDCPKHVWQGVGKISKCTGKTTNMFSAEVFGIVIATVLLLAGGVVGTIFGVRKCRNRDDDIIDYSVRKRLLGLQLGNFKKDEDYNDFDYDAI